MMSEIPRWQRPGYADIESVRVIDGDLEVAFANGDVAQLPLASLGIRGQVPAPTIVDEGLAIRFETADQSVEVSWTTVRSATDSDYDRHVRNLAADERLKVGRRIRALREDRSITQAGLAKAAGIPAAEMSRIEKGDQEVRVSVVRALLRALGAGSADIAGPDALEVSVRTIVTHAAKAGVPRELALAMAQAVPRPAVPSFLAQAFNWTTQSLLDGIPETPRLALAVQFKAPTKDQPSTSPLVHLALSAARLARIAFEVPPYQGIPSSPSEIRREAADQTGRVTLASLLAWTWGRGIPVLPLAGTTGFAAAVLPLGATPTIVIKETRDLTAFWLFDLAHELGHIGRGHVNTGLIDVGSPTTSAGSDADEQSASTFALEVLLPTPIALLDEIRADARGDGVRFKFAVERVAERANVSPGLLGIVAAFALTEVGRPLDRWGSATNLAKPEGSGRDAVRVFAQRRAHLERLPALDAALIQTAVLGG